MQTLPFDPKLGPAIPIPSNFTIIKQDDTEIVIEGVQPNTETERNRHIRFTFWFSDGRIETKCLKQEKSERYRTWTTPPDWHKSGIGGRCASDWILRCLLAGVWS